MSKQEGKKKNPVILFLLAFVVIAIIMFAVNYPSKLEQELRAPESGVAKLSTVEGRLIAISREDEVYTWEWNDLSGWPEVVSIKSEEAAAASSGRVIWVPSDKRNVLVASDLKGGKEVKRVSLGSGGSCAALAASQNGRYLVAGSLIGKGIDRRMELAVTDSGLTSLGRVVKEKVAGELVLNGVAVSDDGAFAAAVGREGVGWILVGSAESGEILWERRIENSTELDNVIFSPDGEMVFASKSDRYVCVFARATGEIARELVIDKYKTPPNNPQTISCITISPDSRLLVAATVPASQVWIWDAKSGAKLSVVHPGQFTVSGVSFSPDSSLLATSDLLGRHTIKLWMISKVLEQ